MRNLFVVLFVFGWVHLAHAETAFWGPENCVTVTTPGAINWNGVEPHLFAAGVNGCFEGPDGMCQRTGDVARIRNVSSHMIWVRVDSSCAVWRIAPGDIIRFPIVNEGGGLFVHVRSCTTARNSYVYERRLMLERPRFGALPVGGRTRYQITITEPRFVQFAVESNSFDTYLRLYHNGILIAQDDDGLGGTNSLITRFLNVGVHTVEVGSFLDADGGAYVLLAR